MTDTTRNRYLALLVMLIILYLSNVPHLKVSDPTTWYSMPQYKSHVSWSTFVSLHSPFFDRYGNVTSKEFLLHKLGHTVVYSSLTYFLLHSFKWGRDKFLLIWLAVAVFATTDEIHQYYVVGRDGMALDIIFDSIVSILTILIVDLTMPTNRNLKEKSPHI